MKKSGGKIIYSGENSPLLTSHAKPVEKNVLPDNFNIYISVLIFLSFLGSDCALCLLGTTATVYLGGKVLCACVSDKHF